MSDGKKEDVALVCASTPDGSELGVLRKRGENVEAAVMRRAEEGKPVTGELVRLTPRDEPLLFDVESIHQPAPAAKQGPAQVASDDYRKGWDRLFAKKKRAAAN